MTLNENIRALRIDAGLSQDELAARLGVSRQSVSKWETGSATPELEKLTAMSGLFGVTLDELVYGRRETEAENAAVLETHKQTGTPKARYVAALILVIVGGVISIVLMLLGVSLPGAALWCSPLILCGIACFKARRHLAFWCVASVYVPVFVYLEIGTGVGFYDIEALLAGGGSALRGIIYAALMLCGVCLTAFGIWIYRNAALDCRWTHWCMLCVMLVLILAPLNIFPDDYFVQYRLCVTLKYLLSFTLIVYGYVLIHSFVARKE